MISRREWIVSCLSASMQAGMGPPSPVQIPRLGGLLGKVAHRCQTAGLRRRIEGPGSPMVALFSPANREQGTQGDWKGEHAGKWLMAASRAALRTRDAQLADAVRRVAGFLIGTQGPDRYIGSYSQSIRFTNPAYYRKGPTWDLWIQSLVILGLLEAYRLLGEASYVDAASKLAGLWRDTLSAGEIDVTYLGSHAGLSATVALDPCMELFRVTGQRQFLELAQVIVESAERRPELRLLTALKQGRDPSRIGTGKIYQLLWTLTGLHKFALATGDEPLQSQIRACWKTVHAEHLTPGGGPWGGVGVFSESFSPPGLFSPYGLVETCSTMAWVQLTKELLLATGEALFADELERTLYNDLMGAAFDNGEDWSYFTLPNGRKKQTYEWACCRSSGPLAIEDFPGLLCSQSGRSLAIQLYCEGEYSVVLSGQTVRITQRTGYPASGDVSIEVRPEQPLEFPIRLRIPGWAVGATVAVNGRATSQQPHPGAYLVLNQIWEPGTVIGLRFPLKPRLTYHTTEVIQDHVRPIFRMEYAYISRGPLVYASGLIDGYKQQESLWPASSGAVLEERRRAGGSPPIIRLHCRKRPPVDFLPFHEIGSGTPDAWRLTWFQLASPA